MKLVYKNFLYEAREYDIHKIKQEGSRKYAYLQNIKYRLGTDGVDIVVGIGQVEETQENTFYPDQIERYQEYIKNGGIIDSFPVQVSPLAYDVESMLQFIEDNSDNRDYSYDLDDIRYPDEVDPFFITWIITDTDEDENFYKWRRLNRKARKIEDCFPPDITEEEKQLLPMLEDMFKFFNENKEYTLTDMNHRFQAVKNLGVTAVYVDPIN